MNELRYAGTSYGRMVVTEAGSKLRSALEAERSLTPEQVADLVHAWFAVEAAIYQATRWHSTQVTVTALREKFAECGISVRFSLARLSAVYGCGATQTSWYLALLPG
jgi:hypothetical protein